MRAATRRREDRKPEEPEEGAPGWVITYGDMMSLLLTFFILLVSFSSVQLVEFQKALGSLKGSLGVLPFHESPKNPSNFHIPILTGFAQTEIQDKLDEMQSFVDQNELKNYIDIKTSEEGIAIRILEPVVFDLGKAELKPAIFPLMQKIAELVSRWPNRIRVEGHTDNLPIKTVEFPSNWELSALRAIRVIHFFDEQCHVNVQKMYYLGYGENKPLVPNNSAANRAKNRRVEIYFENK